MEAKYLVEITDPQHHIVKVTLTYGRDPSDLTTDFFMPSWSPGSYLMREYSRNMRKLKVETENGRALFFSKKAKGLWSIDWNHHDFKSDEMIFSITYEVYCHELTVRTSHIDHSHAFLHGPSYLLGIVGDELSGVKIEFVFPNSWSKLSTALKDISTERAKFIYQASHYDQLIDSPVEIGNQITDGFMIQNKPHNLAFFGEAYPHGKNLKDDMKKITEYIANFMGSELPYDHYLYMTHFKKGLYGGLEHENSTALQFDGRRLLNRKGYLQWISLVSHEYFHTWNVKRIRPIELGPFDYLNENYTKLLWLVEGLTSFVDELFVYQAGLCTIEEYLEMQRENLVRYQGTPGRKFDSVEDSSFDAWIKLYRPDENSKNSTVSYYLKGGLIFSVLNIIFKREGKSFKRFIEGLWTRYQENPKVGMKREEILGIIGESISSSAVEEFEQMLSTTHEIDFEKYYQEMGVEFVWGQSHELSFGAELYEQGGKCLIKSVTLDSPAYKYGLNAGDEILALNHIRIEMSELAKLHEFASINQEYVFTIARLGKLMEVTIVFETKEKQLKELKVVNSKLTEETLKFL